MSNNPTLPKWLRFANRAIIAFNRLGMSFGTWYILSIPDCKTGKMRSTPVSVLHVNGQRYVVTGFETQWVKNARKVGKGILARKELILHAIAGSGVAARSPRMPTREILLIARKYQVIPNVGGRVGKLLA